MVSLSMAGGRKNKVSRLKSRSRSTSSLELNPKPASTNPNTTTATNDRIQTLTKEQLKTECRRRGQKTTGNKTELLQRLGHRMINSNVGGGTATTSNSKRNISKEITTANGDTPKNKNSNKMSAATAASSSRGRNTSNNEQRPERDALVLWKNPKITLLYAFLELCNLFQNYGEKVLHYRYRMISIVSISSLLLYSLSSEYNIKFLSWCLYWIGLGVLSSVGFGTGLHTFILYLGPHIAKVTLAAYECNALNFPSPPYPDEIICPTDPDLSNPPSMLSIMSKVRFEAMLWGAGTALGELPPYFMARAARMSGSSDSEEDDLKEFQELQKKQLENPNSLTMVEKAKSMVENLVRRVGFFGILAAASIPNPLFDLAGMTCGHFLIPFWTFFGATLIGKAIIKMHIQKLGVIIAFNELLVDKFIQSINFVPVIGSRLQEPVRNFFISQKAKLHRRADVDAGSTNVIAWLFEKLVLVMILYFILSIVNSLAQVHHKKIHCKTTRVSGKTQKDAKKE